MGNSLTCVLPPATLHDPHHPQPSAPVRIVHLADRIVALISASLVAELMLEFPGHFVSHLDVDATWVLANRQKWCADSCDGDSTGTGESVVAASDDTTMIRSCGSINSRRLMAMAADAEVVGGRLYVVAPMERLNQRLSAQELTAIYQLLCSHFLSAQIDTTPKTTFDSPSFASSIVRFRIPSLCRTSKVAPVRDVPATETLLLPSDPLPPQQKQHGDISSQTFCFSSVPGSNNLTRIRYKSWAPKLDTICE